MKKLLIVLSIYLCSFSVYSEESVRLAIGEWSPFTSAKNPKGKIAEIVVEEAFKLSGYKVIFSYHPWKRSYELVKEGSADGTFPWYMSDRRKNDFFIANEPIMKEKEVFFHLKSTDFQWKTFDDLKKYRIGGTIGYSHVMQLKEQGVDVDVVASDDINLKKLLAGRIDAAPIGFMVGYDIINRLFSREKADLFTNNPHPLREAEMYGLFSKNSQNGKRYADALSRGISQLKATGRYDEIFESYLTAK